MWFVWFVQGWFLAHFSGLYSVDPNPNYMENYPVAVKWTLQKGHGERWCIAHCSIVFSLMTLPGGRTKSLGRSKVLRRFSGIQTGLCAVLLGCIVTCLRELGGSTDTSRTSLDIQRMLLSCDRITLCRHSLTSALTRLKSSIGVSQQDKRHGGWRMAMYGGTLGCLTLWFWHFFQKIFRGRLMRSKSLHISGAVRGERLAWYLWRGYWRCFLCWWADGSGGDEPWAMVWGHAPC